MGAVNRPAPPPSAVRHLHSASWAPSSLPIRCSSFGLPRRPFLFLLRSPPPPPRRLGNNRVRCSAERHALFNRIAPVYDNLNDMLSLGQHRSWKRMCVSWSGAKRGNRVLDLCCGSGDLVFFLSQKVGTEGEAHAFRSACVSDMFRSISSAIDMLRNTSYAIDMLRNTSYAIDMLRNTSYAIDMLRNTSYAIDMFRSISSAIDMLRNTSYAIDMLRNTSYAIDMFRSISSAIDMFRSISSAIDMFRSISSAIDMLRNTSYAIDMFRSISSAIDMFRSISSAIDMFRSISSAIDMFRSISSAIDMFRSISSAIDMLRNISYVYGLDFSSEQLSIASRREDLYWKACYKNIEWIEGDALDLPFSDGYFDAITIGYGLRNLIDRQKAMCEIFRVLKPGSKVSILDFNKSTSSLVNMLQEWIIDNVVVPTASEYGLSQEYKYLKTSIDEFLTGKELEKLAKEVGFSKAEHYEIGGGFMGNLVATR
ncbi:hypothetical protein C4D60_Mb03t15810 [Musa balbisiana]|uniref:2-phytyl-1,4-beta-naphthoquinone methyltransferase, chloroplastic n=1 Tax=Musa balbisiana TaxID=52838 RepID=A0A4S8JBZ2_MUSBA|nr:hypothetical protein C4D60_Mb03t15810 [Musa balbisiana]